MIECDQVLEGMETIHKIDVIIFFDFMENYIPAANQLSTPVIVCNYSKIYTLIYWKIHLRLKRADSVSPGLRAWTAHAQVWVFRHAVIC